MVANQLIPSTLRWTTLSFASKIEGKKGIFPKPSLPLAVERVVERSNDRVSKIRATLALMHGSYSDIESLICGSYSESFPY